MVFCKNHTLYGRLPIRRQRSAAFTFVEVLVAISLIGVGIATVVVALTQTNWLASNARNSTGAYTVLMNQVDLFQSMSPFNPQKTNQDTTPQIPKDSAHPSYPLYDMNVTAGPRQLSVNGTSWSVPVYQYKDASGNVVIVVNGVLTETVTDLSSSTPALPNAYQSVFTITYTFRNRTYTYSVSTIRSSDI
ncbi:MAG: type II secretion system GspH family protein [Acidobacteriota bacterium]|nr:type II secretion system GspH family protein [Acidobacteriota bacterium]